MVSGTGIWGGGADWTAVVDVRAVAKPWKNSSISRSSTEFSTNVDGRLSALGMRTVVYTSYSGGGRCWATSLSKVVRRKSSNSFRRVSSTSEVSRSSFPEYSVRLRAASLSMVSWKGHAQRSLRGCFELQRGLTRSQAKVSWARDSLMRPVQILNLNFKRRMFNSGKEKKKTHPGKPSLKICYRIKYLPPKP